MGPLVSTGGLYIPGDQTSKLERLLNQICDKYHFPKRQEFKWSPRKNTWMYRNLVGNKRERFYLEVLEACVEHQTKAIVVIADCSHSTATGCRKHEEDVAKLLIERIEWLSKKRNEDAMLVVDRSGGAQAQDDAFLEQCLETIQSGTSYVLPEHISVNALSTDSRFIRLLQAADLVVGSVTAFVAGQKSFAPILFALIKTLFASDSNRIGGVGLKLHPDGRYANLYHWLLGDDCFWRQNSGYQLPMKRRPYMSSSDAP
jgi:hypothetical protein